MILQLVNHHTLLFLAVFWAENVGALVWRAEQTLAHFSSYSSIAPSRFPLPDGLGEAVWNFRATKSPASCTDETVGIYLQYGSLPAVSPKKVLFPDNFYLRSSDPAHWTLEPSNVSISHKVLFPQGGDWYIIAVISDEDQRIRQKGLSAECAYAFSASLEVKESPLDYDLTVGRPAVLTVTQNSSGDGIWVGFTVPPSSLAVDLHVSDCNMTSCTLQLFHFDHASGQIVITNCSNVDKNKCTLRLPSPLLALKHLVNLQLAAPDDVSLEIVVQSKECISGDPHSTTDDSAPCRLMPRLDRYQQSADFSTLFVRLHNATVRENIYTVSNMKITVVPFNIKSSADIGGTLHLQVGFNKQEATSHKQNVRVCAVAQQGQFPPLLDDPSFDLCANRSNAFHANSSNEASKEGEVSGKLYVPYPEEGPWFVAVSLQCYDVANGSAVTVECQNGTVNVTIRASVQSCVDGECSGNGECNEFIKSSDFIVFSSCSCTAGWRGYGCTDESEAKSDGSQLEEVLLLTLSNLFFMPAIGLALYRGYYLEAVVYFYNMFFSTFYHACDGDRINKYLYCMTQYSVLANCDFLGSTISLWVTLVAMAELPVNFNAAVQIGAPLALVVGVLLDRHSLWVIVVPGGVGLLLVAGSWVTRCCKNRKCFPDKRRYLCMLPGVLIAAAGAAFFAIFETVGNYKYVHSAWHVALSVSIIFFLPPRRQDKAKTSISFDETESTEGLMLGPNSYCCRSNFDL